MKPKISRSRMMHISSKDLYAAMNLSGPALRKVRNAAKAGQWRDASAAWGDYFSARRGPMNSGSNPIQAQNKMTVEKGPPDPAVIHEAERVVAHEIHGWQDTITFGKRVDYNADWGVSGKYGMHYLHWMGPLREAFESTGDARYPECFDDLFNQWYEQRDKLDHPIPHHHVIFYELGVGGRNPRLIDHCFSYRKTGILGPRTHERMLKTILGGSRWLYLLEKDDGYRSGNWQMCGSWALVYAGGLFPEFKEAKDWVRVGTKRLLEHAENDFYADGCHHERSTGYGSWCTRITEDLLAFSRTNPYVKLSGDLRKRITRMYDWWASVATPLGESQGFNDGGFGPLDGILENGVRFTGDGKYLWPVRDRVKSVGGIRPKKLGYTSIDQRPSGFAVMRSGWDPKDLYMIVNYGPWGGGHAHNDLLDFAMYAHGAPVTVESNRWGSYDNPLDSFFRSPQAHNQVVVNDTPMDRSKHRGEHAVWASGKGLDYFSASHEAYRDKFGVTIERSFVFLKPDYFLVSDTVTEDHRHSSYTWYLHAPSKWRAGKSRSVTTSKPGLQVIPAKPQEIRHVRQGTSYEKRDGGPGQLPNRYWIGLQKWVGKEGEQAVVYDVALVPFRTKPAQVKVARLQASVEGEEVRPEVARGVRVSRRGVTDLIVYGVPGKATSCGEVSFTGRVCVVSLKGERPASVAVVDGGEVAYGGKVLIRGRKEGLSERRLG
jgi:hypothetical protein